VVIAVLINEKRITPRTMIILLMIFSRELVPEISPYPTVVIVETVK
jgi:hypothetical protein